MKTIALLIAFLAVLAAGAMAQPAHMNYQGRLLDEGGQPLPNGNYTLEFNIYNSPDETVPVWGPFECDTFVANGRFNVILGTHDNAVPARSLTDAFSGDNRFVEIRVNGGAPILPRQQILSAPYALQSQKAQMAQMADVAAGLVKELADALAPVGSILAFAGPAANVPDGWLLCDGRAIRSSEYPALYAAIGWAWGNGTFNADGETNNDSELDFNLPDLRGMFLRGVTGTRMDPDTPTRTFDPDAQDRKSWSYGYDGNRVGSVQRDEVGPHHHELEKPIYVHWRQFQGEAGDRRPLRSTAAGADLWSDRTKGNDTKETRPTNAYVNYIIKY